MRNILPLNLNRSILPGKIVCDGKAVEIPHGKSGNGVIYHTEN